MTEDNRDMYRGIEDIEYHGRDHYLLVDIRKFHKYFPQVPISGNTEFCELENMDIIPEGHYYCFKIVEHQVYQ